MGMNVRILLEKSEQAKSLLQNPYLPTRTIGFEGLQVNSQMVTNMISPGELGGDGGSGNVYCVF